MKHTPGPWGVKDGAVTWKGVSAVCRPENTADARLIASAPELLSALEEVMGCVEHSRDAVSTPAIYRTAQDALRLAADRIDKKDIAIVRARSLISRLRSEEE